MNRSHMERRIKALYIITILAILAFLSMQSYWLYSRYEYSLSECEDQLRAELIGQFDAYRLQRIDIKSKSNTDLVNQSSISMNLVHNQKEGIVKYVGFKITTLRYTAQEVLGLPADHVLTPEEKHLAAEKIGDYYSEDEIDKNTKEYDASNAPSDAHIFAASKNIELEQLKETAFTTEGIDTLLRKSGYEPEISLSVADSVIWEPVFIRHNSAINPSVRLIAPYSELERKTVEIECPIPVSDVLARMFSTLIIILTISLLLILCLTWQFSTILKQNRLDKMRNNFVTTMIHELKRPISTLKMCVSGIENERMLANPEMKSELVRESRGALDNLSAYFSRLRDLTFNRAEQIPLNTTQFSLREAVGEIIGKIPVSTEKEIAVSDDSENDVLLTADRVHILNILDNLIENSIKYSGDRVEIHILYMERGGNVEIKVSDNGDGISQADCRKIFDRFYRSRSAAESEHPGMGLGLAYVRLLVEAHGGEVSVESREGEGTCFTIRLPQ